MRCTERAYAKINLTLDVGAKRADGYHEITSVMQRISLWDTVTVERGTGCDSLLCSVPVTEDVNDNLCMKALRVFFAETAMESGGVSITLEKHIPTQAGLGGGSSDAAAVLLALRTLYAPRMTDMRLERLAEKLGSDVPFFIRGGTQLAVGRGEIVTPLPLSSVPSAPCARSAALISQRRLSSGTARSKLLRSSAAIAWTLFPATASSMRLSSAVIPPQASSRRYISAVE